jgi:hypothetical protein
MLVGLPWYVAAEKQLAQDNTVVFFITLFISMVSIFYNIKHK